MKKSIIFASLILAGGASPLSAQNLNLEQTGVTYSFPSASTGVIPFSENGTRLTLGEGFTFDLNDGARIYVSDETAEDNTVVVKYSADGASVLIAGNIARYVSATVEGAHVSIVQSDEVSETTCGEITYQLSGESDDGSFAMTGSYKASLELLGLTLTNPSGAALDIQNGKRISVSAKNGTVNSLADGADGSQKGCIVCKGHLEFKGKGQLTVVGNASHAIQAKEYVEMKNLTLTVTGAVKDGINCAQYFSMESGTLSISGTSDDGIQVDYKDSADREEEDTGSFSISGGKLTVATTAAAAKAIKTEGSIEISGGELALSTSGTGLWDSKKSKTKAAACLGADADIHFTGGTIGLTSTGGGGKGLSCDGQLTIDDGEINVYTSGGVFAYYNNQVYDNYTGSTDRLTSDQKSSPKGMKADSGATINGGTITIICTGNGGEGIESKADLTINGGTIYVTSADDCINSSKEMIINGGDISCVSTGNDGLDSNGNMYINGGIVRAFGSSSPECGIDVNSEEGYKLYFTGGTILGVGASNSTPSKIDNSQPYVSVSMSVAAGETVTVKAGNEILATDQLRRDDHRYDLHHLERNDLYQRDGCSQRQFLRRRRTPLVNKDSGRRCFPRKHLRPHDDLLHDRRRTSTTSMAGKSNESTDHKLRTPAPEDFFQKKRWKICGHGTFS
ncbi:MAG: carbohydrate-binding domain-containing protein [Clostridium sp.]|nr:carbohydrate-binding domain-containing protein [Clostridium sp.]